MWVLGGWSHDNYPFVRMGKGSRRCSEWNILNPTLARASVGRLIFILVLGRTLVIAAAVFPRAQQQQVAGDDLSAVFPLPALAIFPACGLQLAFDVHLGAFGNVLPDDLRQALPSHNAVPLGSLLPFVVSILEPF